MTTSQIITASILSLLGIICGKGDCPQFHIKSLKSFVLSFAMAAFSLFLYAQSGITRVDFLNQSVQRALSAPEITNSPNIVHLPIVDYYSDNIPIVEATIEGQTYRFVFDTGAEYSIFNSRYIDQSQGGKITSFGKAERANGAESLFGVVKASNFSLGGLEAKTLYMVTTGIDDEDDAIVHGAIGLTLFKDYDVLFDWTNKEIILVSHSDMPSILAERFDIIETLPIKFGAYYITTDCKVNGKRLRLVIDTGAFSCLLPYKKGLKHRLNNIGGKLDAQYRREGIPDEERTFVLGKQKYSNISVCLSYTASSGQDSYDGLLGNNILQLQPILISIKSRQLLLLKQK